MYVSYLIIFLVGYIIGYATSELLDKPFDNDK